MIGSLAPGGAPIIKSSSVIGMGGGSPFMEVLSCILRLRALEGPKYDGEVGVMGDLGVLPPEVCGEWGGESGLLSDVDMTIGEEVVESAVLLLVLFERWKRRVHVTMSVSSSV